MRIRNMVVVCFLSLVVLASTMADAQVYGKELSKEFRKAFGISNQEGKYFWFGYPVNNFGVLTAYDPPSGKRWRDSDRICATFSCLDKPVPTDEEEFLTIYNFASKGQGGGAQLTDSQKRSLGLGLRYQSSSLAGFCQRRYRQPASYPG